MKTDKYKMSENVRTYDVLRHKTTNANNKGRHNNQKLKPRNAKNHGYRLVLLNLMTQPNQKSKEKPTQWKTKT